MDSLLWRSANVTMFFFFLASSLVQMNDEDAYLWVPIYGIPAVLCSTIVVKPSLIDHNIWCKLRTVHTAICLILLANLSISVHQIINTIPNFTLNTDKFLSILEHEEAREFSGVFIVIMWMRLVTKNGDKSRFLLMFGFLSLSVIPIVLWGICWFDISSPHFQYCKTLCKT